LDIFNKDYEILYNLIKKNNLKKCLEVGFIYNFLAKITNDLNDVNLISINSLKNQLINKFY
jgi:hypothetical protein